MKNIRVRNSHIVITFGLLLIICFSFCYCTVVVVELMKTTSPPIFTSIKTLGTILFGMDSNFKIVVNSFFSCGDLSCFLLNSQALIVNENVTFVVFTPSTDQVGIVLLGQNTNDKYMVLVVLLGIGVAIAGILLFFILWFVVTKFTMQKKEESIYESNVQTSIFVNSE